MSMLLTTAAAAVDVVSALPDPAPVQPPGTGGFITVMGWGKWVALAICILCLVGVGVYMAVPSRRNEGGEHIGKIGLVLGGVIVISAAGALVGFLSGA